MRDYGLRRLRLMPPPPDAVVTRAAILIFTQRKIYTPCRAFDAR